MAKASASTDTPKVSTGQQPVQMEDDQDGEYLMKKMEMKVIM